MAKYNPTQILGFSDKNDLANKLDQNFQEISTAIENTLSRDGATPNQMEADLDLNGKRIINVADPVSASDIATKNYVDSWTSDVIWKGPWSSSTTYSQNDVVSYSGSTYICKNANTTSASGTPDVSSDWDLMAEKGKTPVWRGTWTTGTSYSQLDMYEYNGASYVCTQNHISSSLTEPGVGSSWTTYQDRMVVVVPADGSITTAKLAAGVPREDDGPYVIVISGQSNAAGANNGGPNPASSHVHTWDAVLGTWGGSDYTAAPWTYSNPDGNSGNNNYALARAHYIYDRTGREVYIIFDAVGGTSIDEWVASGTASTRYAALKTKVEAALATSELSGKATIDEIIWAQGEEDYLDDFSTHLSNFSTLVDQWRAESWVNDETPIYVMAPSDLHDRYMPQEALRHYCSRKDNRCVWVPSNGLKTEYSETGAGDYTHFYGESLWEAGYYRIADARPDEVPSRLFFGRGTGFATPEDPTVLTTFSSIVSKDSWTSSAPPNGPSATGSISWGYLCNADGNYSYAFGYECTTDNVANYGAVIGRSNTADANADYFFGAGYQNTLSAAYTVALGRGHTVADTYGAAVGAFSKYTTAQTDPVRFQVGIGTTSTSAKNGLTVRESGIVEISVPTGGNDPAQNNELVISLVSDTELKFSVRGSDGVIRTATLTLA